MTKALWITLAIPLVLLAYAPNIIPQAEFDGIRLLRSDALWSILVAIAVLLPFAVALALLLRGTTVQAHESARGIAVGAGAVAVLFLALCAVAAFYSMAWASAGGGLEAVREYSLLRLRCGACLLLILVNVVVVWTARRGSSGVVSGPFTGTLALALLYSFGIFQALGASGRLAQDDAEKYRRRLKGAGDAAESAVRAVVQCAIAYKAAYSDRPLPRDLATLMRVAACDPRLANDGSVPEYRLTFVLTTDDPTLSGSHMGCLVTAEFTGRRLRLDQGAYFSDGRTIISDCSGIVYEHQLQNRPADVTVKGFQPAWVLIPLAQDLNRFAAASHGGGYPAGLRELRDNFPHRANVGASLPDYLRTQLPVDFERDIISWSPYAIRYVPEAPAANVRGSIGKFRIEARCESYGTSCLRSYLMDSAGLVHGTGENRMATATDPVVQECEMRAGTAFCGIGPAAAIP